MKHFFFGLLSLISTAAAATNLRHATDLSVDLRSKQHGSGASASEISIELTNHKGMEYFGPITVGSQNLMAIYDTGSFDIMTVSDHCIMCQVPAKLKVYDHKSSKTFKKGKSSESFQHDFAGGMIMARLDFDTVHMGSNGSTVMAENMPIWQVTDTTLPQWTDPKLCKFTTIVGLGFGKIAPDTPRGIPPVVQLLEQAGTQHFSICLQKGGVSPGYITLNAPYDFKAPSFTSMFQHMPVIGQKHWAVENKGVSYFNGQFTDRRCNTQKCVAIIDSGTSLIGVPGMHMAFISEFASKINMDCSNLAELPDLYFEIGGHTFPLPASAYTLKLDGKCYAAFMQLDLASDQGLVWVLGLPFLRHYYTVWDRSGPSLYVAEQGEKCTPRPISNNTMQLAHTAGRVGAYPEPSMGDISEARLPSWAPRKGEKITI